MHRCFERHFSNEITCGRVPEYAWWKKFWYADSCSRDWSQIINRVTVGEDYSRGQLFVQPLLAWPVTDHAHCDGTFSTCPPLFVQMYTVQSTALSTSTLCLQYLLYYCVSRGERILGFFARVKGPATDGKPSVSSEWLENSAMIRACTAAQPSMRTLTVDLLQLAVNAGLPKTNNALERSHRGLAELMSCNHPTHVEVHLTLKKTKHLVYRTVSCSRTLFSAENCYYNVIHKKTWQYICDHNSWKSWRI